MPLMATSLGPETLTCMLPDSPGPNRITVCALPREITVPVFAALVPSPMLVACGAGFDAGEATEISTLEAACPPVTVIGTAVLSAPLPPLPPPPLPPPGFEELEPPPPHPARKRDKRGTNRNT